MRRGERAAGRQMVKRGNAEIAERRARSRASREVEAIQRRLKVAVGVFVTLLVTGVIGYRVIAGVSFLDALYMTVITVSTVGYREIVDLDPAGQILTIFVIAGGVVTVSYTALTGAEFIIEGHLRRIVEQGRMDREIARLDQHIIIAGFGRVGRHLAQALEDEGESFVIIDNVDAKDSEVDNLGYLHVFGDATEEHVLEEAGIERARAVVATVNADAENVLITLTVKGMTPGCLVIARAKADENERKLERAGADRVIAPSSMGGQRIAQILTRPAVSDFLDGLGTGIVDYTLEEIPLLRGCSLVGKTLVDARIRETHNCTVVAVRHVGELRLDTHPEASRPLVEGEVLVVMGSGDDVRTMRELFL